MSKNRIVMEASSVIASLVAFFGSMVIAMKVATVGSYSQWSFFSVDALGAIIMMIVAFVGLAATIYSVRYLREETSKEIIGYKEVKQYFILLNLFLGAMFLASTSSSPIFTWIAIEATTLSTAFLISFYNKPTAMEAAWKYLIINSVGLLLAFFGTLLYFTSFQIGAEAVTWTTLLSNAVNLDPTIAKMAFVFVLVGYGTKVGLAPMHTWLPDAHSKAPVPISALLSGVLLNVAFIAVLRFKAVTDLAVGSEFSQKLLMAFGLLSVLIAVFIIFGQKNYKRLLAYSSIENMGIIALGFGFGGLGVFAAIFHLIYHSLIKSALFLSVGNIFLKYSSTKIINVRGVITALPVTGVLFLTGFFAITGTPPFGIFLTKIFIISAGIQAHPFLGVTTILLTAILFVGFFKHVVAMTFGAKPAEIKTGEISVWLILPPLVLLTVALTLSFYVPQFLLTLINTVVSQY
ncbi:MAG: proton-conducting transporter membrane subunit [Candidatus Gracilibacteria bacterium]